MYGEMPIYVQQVYFPLKMARKKLRENIKLSFEGQQLQIFVNNVVIQADDSRMYNYLFW